MKFLAQAALLLASAAAAVANTVTFVPYDNLTRTIYFTPSAGHAALKSVTVSGDSYEVEFPTLWIGMWYAIIEGDEKQVGMLGEVTFQGWNGLTYYDVSAIDNPDDHNNVHWLYPVGKEDDYDAKSGCDDFPCTNCYNKPNDVQTKSTTLTDLVCELGPSTG